MFRKILSLFSIRCVNMCIVLVAIVVGASFKAVLGDNGCYNVGTSLCGPPAFSCGCMPGLWDEGMGCDSFANISGNRSDDSQLIAWSGYLGTMDSIPPLDTCYLSTPCADAGSCEVGDDDSSPNRLCITDVNFNAQWMPGDRYAVPNPAPPDCPNPGPRP